MAIGFRDSLQESFTWNVLQSMNNFYITGLLREIPTSWVSVHATPSFVKKERNL